MARTVCCLLVIVLALTKFSAHAQTLVQCNDRKIDLVFILDSSGSVGAVNFDRILDIINDCIDLLNIDALDGIRIGFVVFSTDVSPAGFNLQQFTTRASIKGAISSAPYLAGGTMTHKALDATEEMYANYGRRDAERLTIMITDGRSEEPSLTLDSAISLRTRQDVQVAAIGITSNIRVSELQAIATRGMVFVSDSFDIFLTQFKTFTDRICNVSSPCWDCEYENGVYYSDDATRCHGYFQCRNARDRTPYRRLCSAATFWTQDQLGCDHIANVNCRSDPCVLNSALHRWPYPESCRIYIICNNTRSLTSGCCLEGQAFDPVTEACISDPDCNETCPGDETPTGNGDCNLSPVQGERTKFRIDFTGIIETCPAGYAFVADRCGCWEPIDPTDPLARRCDPEVDITFADGNVIDTQGNVWLDDKNVATINNVAGSEDGWVGRFTGASAIGIPRFTGYDFGSYVQIIVRFQIVNPSGISTLDDKEILVTNGNCGDDPTLFLGYDRFADDNIAKTVTVSGAKHEVFIRQQANNWVTARMIYDTTQLQLITDSSGSHQEESTPVDPAVKIKPALRALWIGGICCAGSETLFNVTALIDRVTIYLCEPIP